MTLNGVSDWKFFSFASCLSSFCSPVRSDLFLILFSCFVNCFLFLLSSSNFEQKARGKENEEGSIGKSGTDQKPLSQESNFEPPTQSSFSWKSSCRSISFITHSGGTLKASYNLFHARSGPQRSLSVPPLAPHVEHSFRLGTSLCVFLLFNFFFLGGGGGVHVPPKFRHSEQQNISPMLCLAGNKGALKKNCTNSCWCKFFFNAPFGNTANSNARHTFFTWLKIATQFTLGWVSNNLKVLNELRVEMLSLMIPTGVS